uniref:Uncharacterized protein n=1 Tax=Daphnia galeata TaxID=27404 RepID=A0A8J2REQ5_9CRUS|nr:unnamed protein product [Daphnia galeata]
MTEAEAVIGCTASFKVSKQGRMQAGSLLVESTCTAAQDMEDIGGLIQHLECGGTHGNPSQLSQWCGPNHFKVLES